MNILASQMCPSFILFIVLLGGVTPLGKARAETIGSLRQFRINLIGASFQVDRDAFEVEIQRRRMNATVSEQGIDFSSDRSAVDDCSGKTAVIVAINTIEDYTLQEQLSDEMKKTVATDYHLIEIAVPFTSDDKHGILFLHKLTDETKQIYFPYSTNHQETHKIDSIETDDDGNVIVRNGTDVMVIKVEHGDECERSSDRELLDRIDHVTGEEVTATDYPLPFDWGCDGFQSQNISFCETLNDHQCEIERFSPDVCTVATETRQSRRCPSSMQILEMTGSFREMFPYLVPSAKSFMGEWVDRVHGQGITFPCLH